MHGYMCVTELGMAQIGTAKQSLIWSVHDESIVAVCIKFEYNYKKDTGVIDKVRKGCSVNVKGIKLC